MGAHAERVTGRSHQDTGRKQLADPEGGFSQGFSGVSGVSLWFEHVFGLVCVHRYAEGAGSPQVAKSIRELSDAAHNVSGDNESSGLLDSGPEQMG